MRDRDGEGEGSRGNGCSADEKETGEGIRDKVDILNDEYAFHLIYKLGNKRSTDSINQQLVE